MTIERIVERVQKLLALADDPSSPEEAALAAKRAAELMARHGIEEATLIFTGEMEQQPAQDRPISQEGKTIQDWRGTLASGIARVQDCKMYWGRWPTGGRSIQIVGRASDREVVSYLFHYFAAQIEDICDGYWWWKGIESGENKKVWCRSFNEGAASSVVAKMRAAKAAAMRAVPSNSTALAVLDDNKKAVATLYDSLGLRSRCTRTRTSYSASGLGRKAGRDIDGPGKAINPKQRKRLQ